MPFNFHAKYGLLTYAQCGHLDPWAVNDHLGKLGAECIVGRETHADGGIHLHCFFMFEKKFRTRDERRFDVHGCHPNVVAGYGTPEKGYDYATKDGEIVAGGLARPSGSDSGVPRSADKWRTICMAESREEFFELVQDLDPRALCVNFSSLKAFADWRYRPVRDEYTHPRGLRVMAGEVRELSEWTSRTFGQDGRRKWQGGDPPNPPADT